MTGTIFGDQQVFCCPTVAKSYGKGLSVADMVAEPVSPILSCLPSYSFSLILSCLSHSLLQTVLNDHIAR